MRKTPLIDGEIYHIYNRGVDKRATILDKNDLKRFIESIKEFNSVDLIGSLYEYNYMKKKKFGSSTSKLNSRPKQLVQLIAYCINPNHYHLLLKQKEEKGIEKFMHRLGTGYTKYFNNKHARSGALFQGKFKSVHVDSDVYLLHLSAYINLNNQLHDKKNNLSKSSWDEFVGISKDKLCDPDIVIGQFKTPAHYEKFAKSSLQDIIRRKEQADDLEVEIWKSNFQKDKIYG